MPRFTILVIITTFLCCQSILAQTPQPTPPTATPAIDSTALRDPKASVSLPTPDILQSLKIPFQLSRGYSQVKLRGPYSGRRLFSISATAGYSAQERAERILNRLKHVASIRGEQPVLLTVLRYENNLLTILAGKDQVLATVGPYDLDITEPDSLPDDVLRQMELQVAEIWRKQLQSELSFAAYKKTPQYLFGIALPVFLLSLFLVYRLQRYLRDLKVRTIGVSSIWGLEIIMWGGFLVLSLWLFPLTQAWAWALYDSFIAPFIQVWLVILATVLLTNLLEAAVSRYLQKLRSEAELRPRRIQRIETFCSVACRTIRGTMMLLAFFMALSLLPFDFLPLVTGAGVAGVIAGLAGQDLLKDVIAGVGILLEDRFGVGDWIEWDKHSGSVETINLHYTQIRTIQGGLVYIPNSSLRVVSNLSNEWAQIDFRVEIAYGSDLNQAIVALEDEAKTLAEELSDQILAQPESKGVQELGTHGVTLRLYLKTKPLLQWDIERELKRRVKLRFDQEGIEIPFPQTAVWMRE